MPKSHEHIFAQLYNTPWLIEEGWMKTIIQIAQGYGDIEAVHSKLSDPLEETKIAFTRDGVAHIPISGPIFPRANLMTEHSGATSISTVAKDLQVALNDDSVGSIILDIDSPGGAATGVHEMGNIIKEASTQKDITAYVGGTAASAAYWLASAASEMVIDATARVGSIGVVIAYPNSKDKSRIEIVNTASPNKRIDPNTKEGQKVVIEELDALADVFISTVAENKGVTEETVRTQFGRGGMLVGKNAVEVGMADRLGSFEKLLAEKSNYGGSIMPSTKGDSVVSAESLKNDHPKVYAKIFEAGASAAVSESEVIIKGRDKEIAILSDQLSEANKSKDALVSRVSSLEKNDVIRSEKEIGKDANSITAAKLSASSIPSRLHAKVSTMLDHSAYVKDGKFDTKEFSAFVDTEVKDWESKLGETSPVQGFSSIHRGIEDSETSDSDVDATVDSMLANAGIAA